MDLSTFLQLLQTASVILAVLVAAGTIKGRSDGKVADMTEIKTDLKYIKDTISCIPAQTLELNSLKKDVEALTRRLEDHLLAHNRKEETP